MARRHEIACDFIAGCDGFHGVCRPRRRKESLPTTSAFIRSHGWVFWRKRRLRPKNWFTPIIERGFALFSMRSPQITRLYLQCAPEEDLSQWPDDRVWEELCARMRTEDGWAPAVGPVIQKGVTGMRSFVIEPMQYGRLFLAGDAAHIVPPTGAKGLNLAISDVRVLSQALEAFYKSGRHDLLDQYSAKMPAAHLESAALFLVDDFHAASLSRWSTASTIAGSLPSSITSPVPEPG